MSWQAVIQTDPPSNPLRYIVGVGPFPDGTTSADFGSGYQMVVVADDAQFQVTLDNEFTYLSLDGLTVTGGPAPDITA